MKKVRLADGTEYEILSFSYEPVFRVYAETPDEMMAIWSKMTHDKTQKIEMFDDEVKMCEHQDCYLMRVEVSQDPKYSQCYGTFYFMGTQIPFIDPEYKQAFDILVGEQDGV